jgi:IrrE N-terminal-like domain
MISKSVMSFDEIEFKARALQIEMWDRQVSLWPGQQVTPLDVCDPEMAAFVRGYDYREGVLDDVRSRAGRYDLAGFIDRSRRLIAVSDRYSPRIKRFTGAHELGHLELHPGLQHHRERPLAGLTEPCEPAELVEQQANHFAGCFLVPRKQLALAFRGAFGVECLRLTDTVAYNLLGASFNSVTRASPDSLVFERLVAQATRYKARHFTPLCELFRVSPTTMAIRLRQVGLVFA